MNLHTGDGSESQRRQTTAKRGQFRASGQPQGAALVGGSAGISESHIGELSALRIKSPVLIAKGGQASIYRAIYEATSSKVLGVGSRQVALKCLHSVDGVKPTHLDQQYDFELAVSAHLRNSAGDLSKHFLDVIKRVTMLDGTQYLVTGLVTVGPDKGVETAPALTFGDLIAQINKCQTPKEREALVNNLLKRFNELCSAISYCHRRGVVHCDLKPSNILIGGESRDTVVVTDFGIAQIINLTALRGEGTPPSGLHKHLNEAVLSEGASGTRCYMAPEQTGLMQGVGVGPYTDVYGLGAILYEMISGRPPFGQFDGLDDSAFFRKLCQDDVPVVTRDLTRKFTPEELRKGLSALMVAVCMKALSRKVQDRYQTVEDFMADFSAVLRLEPTKAYPGRFSERASWFMKRNRGCLDAFAGIAIMMGAAFGIGRCSKGEALEARSEGLLSDATRTFQAGNPHRALGEIDIISRGGNLNEVLQAKLDRARGIIQKFLEIKQEAQEVDRNFGLATGLKSTDRVRNSSLITQSNDLIEKVRGLIEDSRISPGILGEKEYKDLEAQIELHKLILGVRREVAGEPSGDAGNLLSIPASNLQICLAQAHFLRFAKGDMDQAVKMYRAGLSYDPSNRWCLLALHELRH